MQLKVEKFLGRFSLKSGITSIAITQFIIACIIIGWTSDRLVDFYDYYDFDFFDAHDFNDYWNLTYTRTFVSWITEKNSFRFNELKICLLGNLF